MAGARPKLNTRKHDVDILFTLGLILLQLQLQVTTAVLSPFNASTDVLNTTAQLSLFPLRIPHELDRGETLTLEDFTVPGESMGTSASSRHTTVPQSTTAAAAKNFSATKTKATTTTTTTTTIASTSKVPDFSTEVTANPPDMFQEIRTYQKLCHKEATVLKKMCAIQSCDGKCGIAEPAAGDQDIKCYCDKECEEIGDCCHDYHRHCSKSDNITEGNGTRSAGHMTCLPNGYNVISSCGGGSFPRKTHVSNDLDPMVTDPLDGTHYLNEEIFMCNNPGRDRQSIKTWVKVIKSIKVLSPRSVQHLLNSETKPAGQDRWDTFLKYGTTLHKENMYPWIEFEMETPSRLWRSRYCTDEHKLFIECSRHFMCASITVKDLTAFCEAVQEPQDGADIEGSEGELNNRSANLNATTESSQVRIRGPDGESLPMMNFFEGTEHEKDPEKSNGVSESTPTVSTHSTSIKPKHLSDIADLFGPPPKEPDTAAMACPVLSMKRNLALVYRVQQESPERLTVSAKRVSQGHGSSWQTLICLKSQIGLPGPLSPDPEESFTNAAVGDNNMVGKKSTGPENLELSLVNQWACSIGLCQSGEFLINNECATPGMITTRMALPSANTPFVQNLAMMVSKAIRTYEGMTTQNLGERVMMNDVDNTRELIQHFQITEVRAPDTGPVLDLSLNVWKAVSRFLTRPDTPDQLFICLVFQRSVKEPENWNRCDQLSASGVVHVPTNYNSPFDGSENTGLSIRSGVEMDEESGKVMVNCSEPVSGNASASSDLCRSRTHQAGSPTGNQTSGASGRHAQLSGSLMWCCVHCSPTIAVQALFVRPRSGLINQSAAIVMADSIVTVIGILLRRRNRHLVKKRLFSID